MWLNRCAPRFRVRSRKPSDPMGVRRTTRTGRADATSRWRRSYTDNADIDLLWPHQYCSIPASSDGKHASSVLMLAPNCAHRTAFARLFRYACEHAKMHVPTGMHTGCVCVPPATAYVWKAASVACVYGTRTIVIARSDLRLQPKWLPLAACNNALVRCILRFR